MVFPQAVTLVCHFHGSVSFVHPGSTEFIFLFKFSLSFYLSPYISYYSTSGSCWMEILSGMDCCQNIYILQTSFYVKLLPVNKCVNVTEMLFAMVKDFIKSHKTSCELCIFCSVKTYTAEGRVPSKVLKER